MRAVGGKKADALCKPSTLYKVWKSHVFALCAVYGHDSEMMPTKAFHTL